MSVALRDQGPFAGMTVPALQAALGHAQQALIALNSGSKTASVSYGLGGQQRSVTYSRANVDALRIMIQDLQRALGLIGPRRGLRTSF